MSTTTRNNHNNNNAALESPISIHAMVAEPTIPVVVEDIITPSIIESSTRNEIDIQCKHSQEKKVEEYNINELILSIRDSNSYI